MALAPAESMFQALHLVKDRIGVTSARGASADTDGTSLAELQRRYASMRAPLATALAHGPVVLYFFPKSFTSGCTAEAHDFADHIAAYKALGATVVGVSGDSIETQVKFSTQECRSKFLVAADPGLKIAASYDSKVMGLYANRTSYVIAQDGKIAYAYTSLDPDKHVANTLAALRKLKPSS